MPDIQWDAPASLMRVIDFATTEDTEELVARGTLHELVGQVLELPADQQQGLMIRAVGPDWVEEHDADAIRELAARPEFTAAHGAFDTADLSDDADRKRMAPEDEAVIDNDTSAPSPTDARGRDGDK